MGRRAAPSAGAPAMKRVEWVIVLGVMGLLLVILGPLIGLTAELDAFIALVFGWVTFPMKTLPNVHVDLRSVAWAVVLLAGLAAGTHVFLRRLSGALGWQRWPLRWTASGLTL